MNGFHTDMQADTDSGSYRLYSSLAALYDVLYGEKIDYDQQYAFCDEFFSRNECRTVLELGCGSGQLTYRLDQTYDVTGVDAAEEMLAIARHRTGAELVQANICDLDLEQRYDAVVMLGRTLTHMTTDEDVQNAMNSISEHLEEGGILILDSFDKRGIQEQEDTEQYTVDGMTIRRENRSHDFDEEAGTWTWNATYRVSDATGERQVFEDEMTLRSFTRNELEKHLGVAGFEVLQQYANVYFEQESEAAKFVVVARKHT